MQIPLREYGRLLARYLRPQWHRVLLLAVLLAAMIAVRLWGPQVLRSFIDSAMSQKPLADLTRIALVFIAVALSEQALVTYARYVSENVGWTATNQLRADLAEHCLRLDLSFHKARTPGELIERIDGDVNALSAFFSQLVIDLIANVALIFGILGLLLAEDIRVGSGLTFFVLLAFAILVWIRNLAVPYFIAVREDNARFYGFLGERLAGTEELRANGAAAYVMRRFYGLLQPWQVHFQHSGLASAAMWVTSVLVFAVGYAAAFVLSASLWKAGAFTIGTVYLIFKYTDLLVRPIENIRTQLQELQRATASIRRVQELFEVKSLLKEGEGVPIPTGPVSVELENVTFAYEDGEPVLHSLSLQMAPGTVTGLLGRTGSGKSTIARLLLRLYDPKDGAVRVGGVDLRQAHLTEVRQRVGMVTQDVQLFAATVRDNLAFFDPSVDDVRLRAALHELGLADWLANLPAGLDTELEPGSLSAGEAQLLAMARLFLADPAVVVLDEASSRLDPATEHKLEQAVNRLLQGRTAIIIAHRLTTVQRADRIVILEAGAVLEEGGRERLAADSASRFHHLLQTGLEEVLA